MILSILRFFFPGFFVFISEALLDKQQLTRFFFLTTSVTSTTTKARKRCKTKATHKQNTIRLCSMHQTYGHHEKALSTFQERLYNDDKQCLNGSCNLQGQNPRFLSTIHQHLPQQRPPNASYLIPQYSRPGLIVQNSRFVSNTKRPYSLRNKSQYRGSSNDMRTSNKSQQKCSINQPFLVSVSESISKYNQHDFELNGKIWFEHERDKIEALLQVSIDICILAKIVVNLIVTPSDILLDF